MHERVDERVGSIVLQVVVRVRDEVERVPTRLAHHVLVPDVADHPRWCDGVAEAPDERRRDVHGRERAQPGVLVLRPLDEVLDRLVQDREAGARCEDRGQGPDLGIVGTAWGRERRLPHAHCELLGCRVREQVRAGGRVEHQALGLGEVRQRQEDVAVREEQVLEGHARLAAGRVDHRHARTAVVREHDRGLEAQDLGHVVLEHLGVAHEAVPPPERLVGEAEAGEVHRADPVAVTEPFRDLEPVDAARREAVHQHEWWRIGVAGLDVEDLHLVRVTGTRSPREVLTPVTPCVGSIHGSDSVRSRGGRQHGPRADPAMMRAGAPTAVAPGGTSASTTEFAPTLARSPTVTGPSTLAPVPIEAIGSMVGPPNDVLTSPRVVNGDSTTPRPISTPPFTTTLPCGMCTPGCTTTGSPMQIPPCVTARWWRTRGRSGIRRVWQRALAR